MSDAYRPPRGAADIYGEEERRFRAVEDAAKEIARLACFETLRTPIFEHAKVFAKTLGDDSDVVGKEMYLFEDRGGEQMTLRPEFTAGVTRAFLAAGLHQSLPVKFFSTGPLFRYERPQKGRRRQFHQVNFECFGPSAPESDADLIALAAGFLARLGITEAVTADINTLGDAESRARHRSALTGYLARYKDDLSEDSKIRLEKNPLRILDSKNPRDKEICADAPGLHDSLTPESADFFARLKNALDAAGVPYRVNPSLVRGLDYYNHTVFEFITDKLGAQGTVLAGGRYDGLTAMTGGPAVPAAGFAAGVERLAELIAAPEKEPGAVYAVTIGDAALPYVSALVRRLRDAGVPADRAGEGAPKKQFKTADKRGAAYVVTAGGDEIANNTVKLKNMTSGEESTLKADEAIARLAAAYHLEPAA